MALNTGIYSMSCAIVVAVQLIIRFDVLATDVEVRLAAPPRDGEANTELLSFMSQILGVAKSNLTLVKGGKSRAKILHVAGVTASNALASLRVALAKKK
jgi:uncharacterized protein (TIGR00251 family)